MRSIGRLGCREDCGRGCRGSYSWVVDGWCRQSVWLRGQGKVLKKQKVRGCFRWIDTDDRRKGGFAMWRDSKKTKLLI